MRWRPLFFADNTPTLTADIPAWTDGVSVFYSSGVNSGKFLIETVVGGVRATTDTGITVVASTVYDVTLRYLTSSQLGVEINGVELPLVSSGLPASSTSMVFIGWGVGGTKAASARAVTGYGGIYEQN